jgi:hypothetical protein
MQIITHPVDNCALQAVAGGGHLEMAKLLLAGGIAINHPALGASGRTALQAAAEGGHISLVRQCCGLKLHDEIVYNIITLLISWLKPAQRSGWKYMATNNKVESASFHSFYITELSN